MVVLVLLVVVMGTGLLTTHTVKRLIFLHEHADEPIRPWMNVGYLARAYQVPRGTLYQALGLEMPSGRDKRPISALARLQKRTLLQEMELLQKAIDKARAVESSTPTTSPSP